VRRLLIGAVATFAIVVACGAVTLHVYARHTANRVRLVLNSLQAFDGEQGAFTKLNRLRNDCGPACFVTTTHECDPGLCAISFGFDNRWLSRLRIAPTTTLTGSVTVVQDKLDGYILEYNVDADSGAFTAIASVSHQNAGARFQHGRWVESPAVFAVLNPAASLNEKECALALNLGCFSNRRNCRTGDDVAPCTSEKAARQSSRTR